MIVPVLMLTLDDGIAFICTMLGLLMGILVITLALVKKYALHIHQNNFLSPIHKYNRAFGVEYENLYAESLKVKSKSEFNVLVAKILGHIL